jgi:hypothetical protein
MRATPLPVLSNAYFFVSAPPLTIRKSIPAFWATSVNRNKGLVGSGAAQKLRIAKT